MSVGEAVQDGVEGTQGNHEQAARLTLLFADRAFVPPASQDGTYAEATRSEVLKRWVPDSKPRDPWDPSSFHGEAKLPKVFRMLIGGGTAA